VALSAPPRLYAFVYCLLLVTFGPPFSIVFIISASLSACFRLIAPLGTLFFHVCIFYFNSVYSTFHPGTPLSSVLLATTPFFLCFGAPFSVVPSPPHTLSYAPMTDHIQRDPAPSFLSFSFLPVLFFFYFFSTKLRTFWFPGFTWRIVFLTAQHHALVPGARIVFVRNPGESSP